MIYVRSKRQIIMPENTKGGNMKNKFALMWRVVAVMACVCILQDKVYCSAKAKNGQLHYVLQNVLHITATEPKMSP